MIPEKAKLLDSNPSEFGCHSGFALTQIVIMQKTLAHHRDTESTEVAQRNRSNAVQCLIEIRNYIIRVFEAN
jgi:hypothetical protein